MFVASIMEIRNHKRGVRVFKLGFMQSLIRVKYEKKIKSMYRKELKWLSIMIYHYLNLHDDFIIFDDIY